MSARIARLFNAHESFLSAQISAAAVTGTVVASLVIADSPTWAWVGFGWMTWLICKTQDWIKLR